MRLDVREAAAALPAAIRPMPSLLYKLGFAVKVLVNLAGKKREMKHVSSRLSKLKPKRILKKSLRYFICKVIVICRHTVSEPKRGGDL